MFIKKIPLLLAACALQLGIASIAGASQSSDDQAVKETAEELQALRARVDALQRRLDALTADQQQTKAEADAAAAQAAVAEGEGAAIPAQARIAVDAEKPKTDKIYYKGVTITLGGFLAAEYIYRQHNQQNDISTNYSAVPYPNSSLGHVDELRFTARQSRISALMEVDPDSQTHLGFYSEFDFQGAAQTANSIESNSYTPRVRHLYGTIDWDQLGLHLLAGQAWSLVTMNSKGITPRNEVIPPTIDGQYIPGFSQTRQPQIRLIKDFDRQVWLAVSLENPQTTFYTGANALPASVHLTYDATGGEGFDSVNTLSLNHIPDVVAKAVYDPRIADRTLHLEAFGLYRSFYERLNYTNRNVSGEGFGAGLIVPVVPSVLDFQMSGLAGKGIGRYGSAQLTDVTFDPTGNIRPINEIQALAGLVLHATPKFDVYLFFGEEKESAQAYTLATGSGLVQYGYGNPGYSNTGCFSETAVGACVGNTRLIEQGTSGFWYSPYIGSFGRFQYGMQYSYTERKAFDGIGGAPIGNQNMVFASFRYYPF